jgi:hypothetical protein
VTEGTASRPDYQLDRSEEDWSGLCDPAMRGDDPWDRVKYVALGRSSYVSFGGQLRGSYERYGNYNWGNGPQDADSYYLNRLMGHADLHLGLRVRVFAEFQSGLEFGRNGGPRPVIDQDKFGADYEQYCRNVDRWWPRVRGWTSRNSRRIGQMRPIENVASRTPKQSRPSATRRRQKTPGFQDESSLGLIGNASGKRQKCVRRRKRFSAGSLHPIACPLKAANEHLVAAS